MHHICNRTSAHGIGRLFIKITPYVLLVTNGKFLLLSYREIWEIQKDAFIRRYQRLNPPVSSFDADIYRCVMFV